jgi:urease beta subunit
MYKCHEFQFSIRDDLTINENQQFETIFAEICHGKSKIVVGEVYRVPNTNEKLSIQRYETILQKLKNINGDV